jgi:hypothetical protein
MQVGAKQLPNFFFFELCPADLQREEYGHGGESKGVIGHAHMP